MKRLTADWVVGVSKLLLSDKGAVYEPLTSSDAPVANKKYWVYPTINVWWNNGDVANVWRLGRDKFVLRYQWKSSSRGSTKGQTFGVMSSKRLLENLQELWHTLRKNEIVSVSARSGYSNRLCTLYHVDEGGLQSLKYVLRCTRAKRRVIRHEE